MTDAGEARAGGGARLALGVVAALLLALLWYQGYRIQQRLDSLERKVASLSPEVDQAVRLSQQALQRAAAAETASLEAATRREQAEAEAAGALQDAETARREADSAREAVDSARREADEALREAAAARDRAARAQAEAARIRAEAEAEVNRLEDALGQVADTRRTALGLVMNLGSDYLRFEFDKAELRAQDRELLSRIAGILLTSKDYSISVNGHTDDVGSDAYNQKLSERRAQAVRDYLVAAGLPEEILSVVGHGKARPLVPGSSDEARAKNRRVELGIVNTRILYGKPGASRP